MATARDADEIFKGLFKAFAEMNTGPIVKMTKRQYIQRAAQTIFEMHQKDPDNADLRRFHQALYERVGGPIEAHGPKIIRLAQGDMRV